MSSVVSARELSLERGLEEHRRSLASYCYRMLGSVHEAEDAVQETMIRAWRSLDTFENRSGLRPWLYRIATNVCLDALGGRAARALPMDVTAANDGRGVRGAPLQESRWVQPLPGRLVDVDDPADVAVSRESIRLAFVAALQHLLPRQRAVLILRDVLRWRASEVAHLLDTSVDAVHSTLRRARRALDHAQGPTGPLPVADHPVDPVLLERYIDAFERFDVASLVSLLHEDAIISMPPFAFWLRGREAFRRFLESTGSCGHARLVPTEANGCAAVALYGYGPDGALEPSGIHVLEWREGRLQALHAFLNVRLFSVFGLVVPPALDGPG
jgi:RNA polymerase sigma-70 factor (ECF subfamily)